MGTFDRMVVKGIVAVLAVERYKPAVSTPKWLHGVVVQGAGGNDHEHSNLWLRSGIGADSAKKVARSGKDSLRCSPQNLHWMAQSHRF